MGGRRLIREAGGSELIHRSRALSHDAHLGCCYFNWIQGVHVWAGMEEEHGMGREVPLSNFYCGFDCVTLSHSPRREQFPETVGDDRNGRRNALAPSSLIQPFSHRTVFLSISLLSRSWILLRARRFVQIFLWLTRVHSADFTTSFELTLQRINCAAVLKGKGRLSN